MSEVGCDKDVTRNGLREAGDERRESTNRAKEPLFCCSVHEELTSGEPHGEEMASDSGNAHVRVPSIHPLHGLRRAPLHAGDDTVVLRRLSGFGDGVAELQQ